MVWGGGREEGSGWGTHVYLWQIHFDIWQNQYNIVKLNKIKIKKKNRLGHLINMQISKFLPQRLNVSKMRSGEGGLMRTLLVQLTETQLEFPICLT